MPNRQLKPLKITDFLYVDRRKGVKFAALYRYAGNFPGGDEFADDFSHRHKLLNTNRKIYLPAVVAYYYALSGT